MLAGEISIRRFQGYGIYSVNQAYTDPQTGEFLGISSQELRGTAKAAAIEPRYRDTGYFRSNQEIRRQ